MKIQQKKYSISNGWEFLNTNHFDAGSCNLVFAFGSTSLLENPLVYDQIRENYPNADIVMTSRQITTLFQAQVSTLRAFRLLAAEARLVVLVTDQFQEP